MYSTDAKDEIARVRFERPCCPASFLRALKSHSRGGALDARFLSTRRPAIARAALAAAKGAGVHAASGRASGARFAVVADPPIVAVPRAPARNCCRRAWLRGAFLSCGSVADPARAYHLEFCCRGEAQARAVVEVLGTLGVDALRCMRRGRPVVYVKGAEAIADALGQMGASQAVFSLDNWRAVRQTKNDIRRTVNGEAANAARAAASSARQQDAAKRAIARVGISNLHSTLAQAARLRIAHPELTLAELAARARPRVTKSTMAYRMRLLIRLGQGSHRPTFVARRGGQRR